jgi:hypothetical protein
MPLTSPESTIGAWQSIPLLLHERFGRQIVLRTGSKRRAATDPLSRQWEKYATGNQPLYRAVMRYSPGCSR